MVLSIACPSSNEPTVHLDAKNEGAPGTKATGLPEANILADVPLITAPLLIEHGEDDPQVLPYESVQFTEALKKAGKTISTSPLPIGLQS